jgi:hypothetical protein
MEVVVGVRVSLKWVHAAAPPKMSSRSSSKSDCTEGTASMIADDARECPAAGPYRLLLATS